MTTLCRARPFLAVLFFACGQKDNQRSLDSAAVLSSREATTPSESSAVAFVREFYQLYAPRGIKSGLAATDSIVRERPGMFSPELLGALKEDARARAGATGEIVGLDFDPFLASQDPCDNYEIGKPTDVGRTSANILVPIFARCRNQRDSAAVIAEVTANHGSWVFANFHYPAPPVTDLLTTLKNP